MSNQISDNNKRIMGACIYIKENVGAKYNISNINKRVNR